MAIDTSVWLESIAVGARYYREARALIERVLRGELTALVTPVTATEVLYASYRLYVESGLSRDEALRKARALFGVLYTHPNVRVVISRAVAELAAEIKIEFKLALSDCYIIAAAALNGAPVVFKDVEREMRPVIKQLRSRFRIFFLSELRGRSLDLIS